MLHALYLVAFAALILCAVEAWVFVVLYSRVRWYGSPEGRHLMKFTAALALTFSLTLLFALVHPEPMMRAVLSIAVFGWIGWELGNRIRLHLRAKRENRQEIRDTARDKARDAERP